MVLEKKLSYLSANYISWEETLEYTGVNSKYTFTGGCFGYGKKVSDWGYHFCFLVGTGTVAATSAFSETGQTAFGLVGDLFWNWQFTKNIALGLEGSLLLRMINYEADQGVELDNKTAIGILATGFAHWEFSKNWSVKFKYGISSLFDSGVIQLSVNYAL